MNFSVLMSVYIKESPEFLKQALESILINQTLPPSELILVKDGPLTKELDNVIEKFVSQFPDVIIVIALEKNLGLGRALNIGLKECTYDLVARMDSDDVCVMNRFEKQIAFFKSNSHVDIVGGNIVEFSSDYSNPIAERIVPTNREKIIKMMKKRNPMNHVTVMFRKDGVIKAGGYKHLPYLEDYYLWIRMIENQLNMANINENLVYVRTGEAMYKRRGNKEYIGGWYYLQKKMKKLGIISNFEVIIAMMSIFGFIYMPVSLREVAYKKLLRS